jgi:DNA-binding PadR family transcriptional regulator
VRVEREETVEGRLRRYYVLTGEGREALVAEADRLAAAARVVKRRRSARVARGVA